ncbi:MAG: nicotinate-nucleotide adenylyltransferase [Acidimicrobiales bacterium]
MRRGVFGGTFDPVHLGHLVAAVNAAHAASLDEVLLVVANRPWQKAARRRMTPAADRYALVEAAVRGVDGLRASDIELRHGGESYTADTLAELASSRPSDELFLVVGADVAAELQTWERFEEVAALAAVVVVNRPGVQRPVLDGSWRVVHAEMPALDISSTDLRSRAADGRPLRFLVPDAAIRCIGERGLYAGGR